MSRHTFDVYQCDFDDDAGKTIYAKTCPVCTGEVRTDGGQIECRSCGAVLNKYARTGQVSSQPDSGHSDRTPEEAL